MFGISSAAFFMVQKKDFANLIKEAVHYTIINSSIF